MRKSTCNLSIVLAEIFKGPRSCYQCIALDELSLS